MRSILSAVAVLLLGLFAYLFFTDYFRMPPTARPGDFLTNTAFPPATPAPVIELAPLRPVVAPPAPVPAPVAPPAPVDTTPPPVPVPAPAVAQPEARRQTHVVQRGDTLSSISRQHYGSEAFFSKIAAANGLKNQDRIRVGQVLILPEIAGAVQPETPIRTAETEQAASTLPLDFEPIPPTLNITVPRK